MTKSKKKESRRRKALRELEEGKAQDEKESFHPPLRANYMNDPALSVREVETLVRNSNDSVKNEKPIKKSKLQEYLEYQQSLTKKFSSKVAIKADEKGRGTIKILFKSQAELQRILDILG